MHTYAPTYMHTWMQVLTRRMRALDQDFNAQDMANILWAFATLRSLACVCVCVSVSVCLR